MPTLEVEGFRLTINSRDERGHGAHVHVIKAGSKVLITLDSALTPFRVIGNFGRLMEWWIEFNG